MKLKTIAVAGILSLSLTACLEPIGQGTKSSLQTDKDRFSYALGSHFGVQAHAQLIARDSLDIDLNVFIQGFKERFNQDSAKYLMNDSIIFVTLNELSQKAQAERAKKDSIAAEEALATQKAFLEKNKTQEGVVTTASGLQYKVLKEGTGEIPNDSSIVSVHYTGTLLDGKKFDSSVDRGKPMEFPVRAVIPGWTEMLKLMKTGSKVQAWIPSELGYGARKMSAIPANSLLVFEMELLEIKAPENKAANTKK
jgi:FKBP-type peptidyl-prolyl cis-trans isomerase